MNKIKSDDMKTSVITTFIIVVILILTFVLGGIYLRSTKYSVKEDGYFKYIVVTPYDRLFEDKDDPVAIVGLTSDGCKQEYLHIPREIRGYPVRYIGFDETIGGNRYNHPFSGSGIKKIYVYDNVEYIEDVLNCESVDLMLCSDDINFKSFVRYFFKDIYVNKDLYDSVHTSTNGYKSANVSFLNNFPSEVKETYYSIDNIKTGEKISIPSQPTYEGYQFTGWYTEKECINKFDFSISPVIEGNETFRLYAGWNR